MKQRALARLALHADIAPHQLHVLTRNSQAQTRTLLLAGIANLYKRFEDLLMIFGFDTNPRILDFQQQMRMRIFLGTQTHNNLSLLGEFNRITDKVQQHLAQAGFVTLDISRKF